MTPSLREALAELVALHDERLTMGVQRTVPWLEANERAWEAARRCLEAGPVETPSVHQGESSAQAVQRPADEALAELCRRWPLCDADGLREAYAAGRKE